jgi:glycosyltransferase involved in cell wall biosynthesis
MTCRRSVSVVTPVYNERQLLSDAVHSIDRFLAGHLDDYELILVESGSTDGSDVECDRLAAELERVIVIHEGTRRGFGSAVRRGYAAASKELLWLVTVDLPFPLDSLADACQLIDDYPCVLSYRSIDVRGVARKAQSLVYNRLIKLCLGIRARQVNSAFKLLDRQVVQGLPLISDGWFLDAELVYRLERSQVPYTQIPVPLVDRQAGRSSVRLTTSLTLLRELLLFLRHGRTVEAPSVVAAKVVGQP